VPAGPYNRTYTNTGSGATDQADPASVSAFRLDKYEVTVGRYRQFVAALDAPGGWMPPAASGKHAHLNAGKGLTDSAHPGMYEPGWLATDDVQIPSSPDVCDPSYATWTPAAGQNESLPINCVNWYEAYAFCIWDGGFLPSEAEREYAAAGGSAALEYPWGTAAPGMGSAYAIYGCFYPDPTKTCTGFANLAPVGTAVMGQGPYHHMDLVGEVAEWSLDWSAGYVDPCVDCAYLAPVVPTDGAAATRVLRGGLFNWVLAEPATRESVAPTTRISFVGFRCARSP
jgi:formylglycine-generating enzyme required for sulfatase activity